MSSRTLAVLGGTPAFATPLHVGRPNIGDRAAFAKRIDGMFDRRWLTNNGPLVQEFEERVRTHVGAKHCVAFANATVAMEVLGRAANLSGEVIVPGFTFVASAHAFEWLGLKPVFCDVVERTHTIDPAKVEALITPKTSAIIATHVWGQPCDVDALTAIAKKHNLKLFFDAAHAFGCSYRGTPIGQFGDAEVFSFHATKFVNCFEGGAIVTHDDALANALRGMRNFGFAGLDNVTSAGTNAKMPEPCAAMGLTSLDAMSDIVACNDRNLRLYAEGLGRLPGLSFFEYDRKEQNNFQYAVSMVGPDAALTRDELALALEAEGVLVRKYFTPGVHRMQPYRSWYPTLSLPVTERLCGQVMALPNGTAVTVDDAQLVCTLAANALANAPAVRAALQKKK